MDRQDIDALLIGALYGELTPADEARLTVHLESHPGDRNALDDLKVARQAVADSRIFAVHLEPPQAVSALLLQEAHRRAPKRVVAKDDSAKESWFYRFTRSFMAHPAMAAAAMLVLVLGGAGIVYMKKGDQFAAKEMSVASEQQRSDLQPASYSRGSAAPTGQSMTAAAGSAGDGYNAGLYELDAAEKDQLAGADNAKADEGASASARWEQQKQGEDLQRAQLEAQLAKRQDEAARQRKSAIEVTTDKGMVKEFEEAKPSEAKKKAAPPADRDLAFGDSNDDGFAQAPATGAKGGGATANDTWGQGSTGTRTGTVGGTGAGAGSGMMAGRAEPSYAQPPAAPPPPPAQVVPAPEPAPGSLANKAPAPAKNAPVAKPSAPTATASAEAAAPRPTTTPSTVATTSPKPTTTKTATTSAPKTATPTKIATTGSSAGVGAGGAAGPTGGAPKPDATVAIAKDSKLDTAKQSAPQRNDALIAWAKGEHQRAIALAAKGQCSAAAKVALTVSTRASSYYSQFMATDRSLKQCATYIAAEREKAAEKAEKARAAKRVNADEADAPMSTK